MSISRAGYVGSSGVYVGCYAPNASESQKAMSGPIIVVMPLAEQRGGAELALMHLVEHGGPAWAVVFLEDGPMVEQTRSLGVSARVIPSGRLRQPVAYSRCVRSITGWAKKINASAILGWMGKAHLYGGPAALLARRPAIWFQHGIPAGHIDNLATRIPARGILACSQYVASLQNKLRPSRPVRVVHPGFQADRFDSRALPPTLEAREQLNL
ncbi:MAG: hypothetical protein AAF194_04360, partial [Pseudomonadota bacterium]